MRANDETPDPLLRTGVVVQTLLFGLLGIGTTTLGVLAAVAVGAVLLATVGRRRIEGRPPPAPRSHGDGTATAAAPRADAATGRRPTPRPGRPCP